MRLQSGQALFFLMDLIEAVREGDHADEDGQTELDHEIDDPADQGEDEEDIGGDPGQDGPAQGMPATIYAVMMLCRMPRGMRKSVPPRYKCRSPVCCRGWPRRKRG